MTRRSLTAKQREEPKRVQRKRTKGYRMPANSVYVGRPTRFDNPFQIGRDGSRERCVDLYRRWLGNSLTGCPECDKHKVSPDWLNGVRPLVLARVEELRGKNLACWCPLVDQHGNYMPCHADLLLEIANR